MTLNGIKAPTRTDRNVETSGSEVNFSTDLGMDGYRSVPALKVNARHFTDSAAKDIKLSPEKLGSIDSLEALKKVVSETFEANKDYLEASEFKSKNETLGVAGLRKQAFFSDLAKTLGTSALPEDQLSQHSTWQG